MNSTLGNISMEPVHHEYLYFSDGNIILSAIERTTPTRHAAPEAIPTVRTILFRVHKSLLEKHSSIFSDMLALPDNPHDTLNPIYDGVPVVIMPDSSQEVEDLLTYFYEPWRKAMIRYDYECVQIVENLLTMANKYQFYRIRDSITRHLAGDWAVYLHNWDVYADIVGARCKAPWTSPDEYLPEPASVITLARKHNIFTILPAAFYDLSTIPTLNDWEYRYGMDAHKSHDIGYQERTARWRILCQNDLVSLYQGRELLATNAQDFSENKIFRGACSSGVPCLAARRKLARYLCDSDGVRDILRCLQTLPIYASEALCVACRDRMESRIREKREEIWKSLPDIFNLPKECQTLSLEEE